MKQVNTKAYHPQMDDLLENMSKTTAPLKCNVVLAGNQSWNPSGHQLNRLYLLRPPLGRQVWVGRQADYWDLKFLNQAHAWFLEIVFVGEVGIHVCVPAPQAIKNHLCEMKPE